MAQATMVRGTFLRIADVRSQPANISVAASRSTPSRRVVPSRKLPDRHHHSTPRPSPTKPITRSSATCLLPANHAIHQAKPALRHQAWMPSSQSCGPVSLPPDATVQQQPQGGIQPTHCQRRRGRSARFAGYCWRQRGQRSACKAPRLCRKRILAVHLQRDARLRRGTPLKPRTAEPLVPGQRQVAHDDGERGKRRHVRPLAEPD
jgi:hypothetical protein